MASRSGGDVGYVNLLSHSPIDTPCPDYRGSDFDFLDDTINVTAANGGRDGGQLLCQVEIHERGLVDEPPEGKNLLDFDTDDENILSSLNVLVSDDSSLDFSPKRFAYPDANSHSNYNLLTDDTPSSDVSRSRNLDVPRAFPSRDKNAHKPRGSDRQLIPSVNSGLHVGESYDAGSSYSVANSHGVYGILSEESERTFEDLSRERLIPLEDSSNYEIANSHSNYQVFYNRTDRPDWQTNDLSTNGLPEPTAKRSTTEHESCETFDGLARSRIKMLSFESPNGSESSDSSKSTEETSDACDIEECLIQIEESLMNIEQNLLHVQQLDIPELKTLLHESPGLDRSVNDAQDLLCTDNLECAKRGKKCLDNDQRTSDDRTASDSRDRLVERDENFLQFTDEGSTSDAVEYSTSVPSSNLESAVYQNADGNVNFIPNSLGKIPSRCSFGETRDNIRAHDSTYDRNDREGSNDIVDVINYNINDASLEKKLVDRKNCHSRTNSLDEHSIFQCLDNYEKRKSSLENLFGESNENYLEVSVKARSEDALGNLESAVDGADAIGKPSCRTGKKSRDRRIAEVEAKAEDFRRMIENIVTSRRVARSGFETSKRSAKIPHRCTTDGARTSSREKSSPRTPSIENAKIHSSNATIGNDPEKNTPPIGKPHVYEKRKRKKLSRAQSAENALVPSKIISLSLSLLLAALLQAVRCLADLVEDAFRSVSFEKNGLLE